MGCCLGGNLVGFEHFEILSVSVPKYFLISNIVYRNISFWRQSPSLILRIMILHTHTLMIFWSGLFFQIGKWFISDGRPITIIWKWYRHAVHILNLCFKIWYNQWWRRIYSSTVLKHVFFFINYKAGVALLIYYGSIKTFNPRRNVHSLYLETMPF